MNATADDNRYLRTYSSRIPVLGRERNTNDGTASGLSDDGSLPFRQAMHEIFKRKRLVAGQPARPRAIPSVSNRPDRATFGRSTVTERRGERARREPDQRLVRPLGEPRTISQSATPAPPRVRGTIGGGFGSSRREKVSLACCEVLGSCETQWTESRLDE